jgi:hypothetical protein
MELIVGSFLAVVLWLSGHIVMVVADHLRGPRPVTWFFVPGPQTPPPVKHWPISCMQASGQAALA